MAGGGRQPMNGDIDELRQGQRLAHESSQGRTELLGCYLASLGWLMLAKQAIVWAMCRKIKEREGWASLGEKLGFGPNG
jgi:hypothetical protein